jgi:hypothetical protein
MSAFSQRAQSVRYDFGVVRKIFAVFEFAFFATWGCDESFRDNPIDTIGSVDLAARSSAIGRGGRQQL